MVRSYTHSKTPKFEHDCDKCEFIVSITDHNGNCVDVYKSCNTSINEYLLRFGPDEKYATAGIESLAVGYMYSMDSEWRKE